MATATYWSLSLSALMAMRSRWAVDFDHFFTVAISNEEANSKPTFKDLWVMSHCGHVSPILHVFWPDRYWLMWAACSVFLSSPQRWIYEARGLIHNQIMWAWDSWTALLSIFLTQGKKTERGTSVLSASQITQRDSVSVRTTCWALNLTSEEMTFQLWSLHNCQQTMVLKGSLQTAASVVSAGPSKQKQVLHPYMTLSSSSTLTPSFTIVQYVIMK